MFKFAGKRPEHLGVSNGRLAPLKRSPNGVSSQADPADSVHYVPPLAFKGDAAAAMQRLRALVERQPRTAILESRADYLRAEFATPLMGFVDDVEFYCDGAVIQVRSASRLGYSDLGVNRARIEALRKAFTN